jgi:hypothetical protein
MNDFLFLAYSCLATLMLRTRVDALLTRLCLLRNPRKNIWISIHVGDHLGLAVDETKGGLRAPPDKLLTLPQQASSLLN